MGAAVSLVPIGLRQLTMNANRWQPNRLSSVRAARCFDDGEFDFVFIDAKHSYAAANSDIAARWPMICKGGLFIECNYSPKRFPCAGPVMEEFSA